MQIATKLFWPHLHFVNSDAAGQEFGSFFTKATFTIDGDGALSEADEHAPLSFTDTCYQEVNTSSLHVPSDLVSYKPKTDIHITGVARSPSGAKEEAWPVSIEIRDPKAKNQQVLHHKLWVTGPRKWVPQWKRALDSDQQDKWQDHRKHFKGWELSEITPTKEVPLRYEYAFGGMVEHPPENEGEAPRLEAHEYNPLGVGWLHEELTDHTQSQAAPQILPNLEALDPSTPYAVIPVAGVGPIPPAWLPRRPLGGTYDQNWVDNIWPKWAPDYQWAYNNSAPKALQTGGSGGAAYLWGHEEIILSGFKHGQAPIKIQLPDVKPFAILIGEFETGIRETILGARAKKDEAAEPHLPRLDTVHISLADEDRTTWRVMVTWRLPYHHKRVQKLQLEVPANDSGLKGYARFVKAGGHKTPKMPPLRLKPELTPWPPGSKPESEPSDRDLEDQEISS